MSANTFSGKLKELLEKTSQFEENREKVRETFSKMREIERIAEEDLEIEMEKVSDLMTQMKTIWQTSQSYRGVLSSESKEANEDFKKIGKWFRKAKKSMDLMEKLCEEVKRKPRIGKSVVAAVIVESVELQRNVEEDTKKIRSCLKKVAEAERKCAEWKDKANDLEYEKAFLERKYKELQILSTGQMNNLKKDLEKKENRIEFLHYEIINDQNKRDILMETAKRNYERQIAELKNNVKNAENQLSDLKDKFRNDLKKFEESKRLEIEELRSSFDDMLSAKDKKLFASGKEMERIEDSVFRAYFRISVLERELERQRQVQVSLRDENCQLSYSNMCLENQLDKTATSMLPGWMSPPSSSQERTPVANSPDNSTDFNFLLDLFPIVPPKI